MPSITQTDVLSLKFARNSIVIPRQAEVSQRTPESRMTKAYSTPLRRIEGNNRNSLRSLVQVHHFRHSETISGLQKI